MVCYGLQGSIANSATGVIKLENTQRFTRIRIYTDGSIAFSSGELMQMLTSTTSSNVTVSTTYTINGCLSLVFDETVSTNITLSLANSSGAAVNFAVILDYGTE